MIAQSEELDGKPIGPKLLREMTSDRMSHDQRLLRERGLSENTISGNLAYLAAGLRWTHRIGLLVEMPEIPNTKRSK